MNLGDESWENWAMCNRKFSLINILKDNDKHLYDDENHYRQSFLYLKLSFDNDDAVDDNFSNSFQDLTWIYALRTGSWLGNIW